MHIPETNLEASYWQKNEDIKVKNKAVEGSKNGRCRSIKLGEDNRVRVSATHHSREPFFLLTKGRRAIHAATE
jgi:hypothetical protein